MVAIGVAVGGGTTAVGVLVGAGVSVGVTAAVTSGVAVGAAGTGVGLVLEHAPARKRATTTAVTPRPHRLLLAFMFLVPPDGW